MTRVAVCDLGTNSTRLLIADVDVHRGSLVEVDRRLTITRLGEGVDASHRLAVAARRRVEAVVSEYATAVGDPRRRAQSRRCHQRRARCDRTDWSSSTGSSSDSASLTGSSTVRRRRASPFSEPTAGRDLAAPTLVVDLGGGSTELVVGTDGGIDFGRASTWDASGSPSVSSRPIHRLLDEIDELRSAVRELLGRRIPATLSPTRAIGVAGTVTTLASLHLGLAEEDPELVHGHILPARWLAAEAAALARTPIADLLERRGLVAGRAPVIAAGALAVAEVLTFFQVDELEVSERDILHGVALELAS